jgi:hypothetical protein
VKELCILPLLLITFALSAQVNNNIIWQKTIGCSGYEAANDIVIDTSGNYFLSGYYSDECSITDTIHGFWDGWIIKLDNAGNKIWSRGLGGSNLETFVKVLPVSDGGVVALGYEESDFSNIVNKGEWDFWLVKLDSMGNLLWQKNYGGSDFDVPKDIIETANGDLITIGFTVSKDGDITDTIGGTTDAWALRLDNSGNIIWKKTYGSTNSDYFNNIIKMDNGNYLVLGESWGNDNDGVSNHGSEDIWLVALDDSGVVQWSKSYGGTDYEAAASIIKCDNMGGYIFSCYSRSNDFDFNQNYGQYDVWLVKLDSAGNIEWKKNYGGSSDDAFSKVVQSKEGGYMLFATSGSNDIDATGNHGYSDLMAVKVNDTGTVIWTRMYGALTGDKISGLIQLQDSSYIVSGIITSGTGDVSSYYGNSDTWLFNIWKDSVYIPNSVLTPFISQSNIQVYPTITNNTITIKRSVAHEEALITIVNVQGQLLLQQKIPSGKQIYKVDISSLPDGMYFLKMIIADEVSSCKIIKS